MKTEEIMEDVLLINSEHYYDDRGSFLEVYNKNLLSNMGNKNNFIQDNISFSNLKNTIRGLHYQKGPFQQSKLVYPIKGSIFDVFIDARPTSKNFGKFNSIILDRPDKSLLIPRGFLHGFCTLEDNTIVGYKVDNPYNKNSELGVKWDDVSLQIDWPLDNSVPILSKKDSNLLTWKNFLTEMDAL